MIKICISVTSHALDPSPLSQTVTPSRTPSPSSVAYFMDGPQATASTGSARLILQTPKETPTTVMTIANSVKLLDGMTIVGPTCPLDLHGVDMKMNSNLNVSSAVKNVISNSYSCISMTLFI